MTAMPNKGGRPRSFDRDCAVDTAMRLFRRHGYEGVSLAMLTGAIGVAPPSLYAAFGSKAGLYREAVDRYADRASLRLIEGDDPDLTLDQAVTGLFDRAILLVAGQPGESGCMISTGLLGCHPDHEDLAEELRIRRAALARGFADELGRWLLRERCDGMAAFLCAVLQGLAVQARDGVAIEDLRTIAATARSCFIK